MKALKSWRQDFIEWFNIWSIRYKIIVPYFVLALASATLGTYIVTQLISQSFDDRFTSQLLEAGRIVSDEVVTWEERRLNVARQVVNTSGVSQAVETNSIEELDTILGPIMTNETDIDSLIIVDESGQEIVQYLRASNTFDRSEFDTQITSGQDYSNLEAVSDVLSFVNINRAKRIEFVENRNRTFVYTVNPIRRSENEAIGAALVGVDVRREASRYKIVSAADVVILNMNRELLASTFVQSSNEIVALLEAIPPERFNRIVNNINTTQVEEITIQEESYRFVFVPYEFQGRAYGVIAVGLPSGFIGEINQRSSSTFVIVFSLAVGVILISGMVVSHHIISRVMHLVETTKDITRGNLNRRTGLHGQDEVGILATNFDQMTAELQRKTVELEEQASKLSAILSSIADGVIVQGMNNDILTINPAAESILETLQQDSNSELPDNPSTDGAIRLTSNQPLQELLASLADLAPYEKRRLEMGERVVSALSAPVITTNNESLGIVVVLRDITQEVIAERLKDKFIQSVSHELKTPMFPLTGSINLIKMILPMISSQVNDNLYEKLQHNANIADEQASDIKNVVMAMVDLSEIDADNFAITRDVMNLTEMVELVSGDWYAPMEEKGLEFDMVAEEDKVWINGDWEKLTQVVRTLLKNSYNYTLEGKVTITIRKNKDKAEIVIKDTGVGILEKDQPHLFSRFYRAIHDKKTFELSGIGLGLYLSKVIVGRHDGIITMESKPYGGSTFVVALPLVPAPTEDDWDDDEWGDDWADEPVEYETSYKPKS